MKETKSFNLYPGIDLTFYEYSLNETACCHRPEDNIIEINYCRSGRIGWEVKDGSTVYLGAGDFGIHSGRVCSGTHLTFPNGEYSGLSICIDLGKSIDSLTDFLADTPINGELIYNKFCSKQEFSIFPGNEPIKGIFGGFFDIPIELEEAYYKLKLHELLLYLYRLNPSEAAEAKGFRPEQIELIKQVHDTLTTNLDKRITIEELSKQFLINPSSMKIIFKAIYGNSIAAHIKEHRMEKAAELLQGEASVSEAAKSVGYDSQSKFSFEFKKAYQMLPTEYKKTHKRKGEG